MRNGEIPVCPYVSLIFISLVVTTSAQCTFPAPIRGNWISSEKGTLNFTADRLYDYPLPVTVTVRTISFFCKQQIGDLYFLQSIDTFDLFSIKLNAFLCLEIHRISSYKFWYQVANAIDATTLERFTARHESVDVSISDGCNRVAPYETATFNVLVQEGAFANGVIEATCPFSIFHTYANGTLTSADGSTSCVNAGLDVCEERTQMRQTFDASCHSTLKFASEGVSVCLLDMTNETSGVTYLHVWNNDTTLATGVERINCYAFESSGSTMTATLYPGACKEDQTSTSVVAPGIKVVHNSITKTCQNQEEGGPQTIYYVAIICGIVFVIIIVLVIVIVSYKTKCRCITKHCRKQKIGHSEASLTPSMEAGLEPYLRAARKDLPPGVFVPRKPIKLGPILEPYMVPPAKVELLYDIEPRPTSSRVMFSRSLFSSQISLKA